MREAVLREAVLREAVIKDARAATSAPVRRPPTWLILATAALTFCCLAMAVAETTLWMHFLIDQGEYLSLGGLAFILAAGVCLYRRGELLVSLPLVFPWLLYPVITQGDQLIDNLTINQMRAVCDVLLALLFGAPVAVVVLAARFTLAPRTPGDARARRWTRMVPGLRAIEQGRVRTGGGLLAATLFIGEIWIAYRFLGTLMVLTLVGMALGALAYAAFPRRAPSPVRARGERFALAVLVTGVVLSFGLYIGYKNRPGAYQGSPAYYMDPSQQDAEYPLQRIAVPRTPADAPSEPAASGVTVTLATYARALQQLVDGYYIADRNYNYAFHNALFLRNTPVLPDFRRVALERIAGAGRTAAGADVEEARVERLLPPGSPLVAFMADVKAYVEFNLRRAVILESKTAEFEQTKAGLQHATHIYEGEAKIVGIRLMDIIHKHRAVTSGPAFAPMTGEFLTISRQVYEKYSNRIVGF